MKIPYLISTISFFLTIQISAQQQWNVTEMATMPKSVANNAVVEGFVNGDPYIFSFAGIDSTKVWSGLHLDAFRYNVNQDVWEAIAPVPDTLGKIAASANRIGNIIYVIGGYHVYSNNSEKSSDRVHRYDVNNNVWLTDGAPIPVPIDDQVQAVWRDSLIFVVTGWSDSGNVPDVQIYNPESDTWMAGTSTPNSSIYKAFGAAGTIVGDSIYYYGGAGFAAQRYVRKGIINPDNPTEIEWSFFPLPATVKGYRPAATHLDNDVVCWIGGSTISYNFDGLSYTDNSGVPPANRSIAYEPSTGEWVQDFSNNLPMDLRGIGELENNVRYLAGGMIEGQMVTNKTFRLEWLNPAIVATKNLAEKASLKVFPNPTTSTVYIDYLSSNQNGSVLQLRNWQGILLKEWTDFPSNIEINDFPNGYYLLELKGASFPIKLLKHN